MNLWIRDQDKERLIKVEDLYIEFIGSTNPELDYHRIVTDRFIDLGTYKTKERALEVLDEIQTHIATHDYQHRNKNAEYLKYESCIYEMPKE